MKSFFPTLLRCCAILIALFTFGCKNQNELIPGQESDITPLFNLLTPQQTGIYFKNILEEGPNTNILMYEYFYNGAGVAAGDFNDDGFTDLYFSSNMGENKMYINKGNMHFEDITEIAKVSGRPGPWKTGVTIVDINGDNKLDLYVCYSGSMPAAKRVNQLFLNQGNNSDGIPVFVEKAEEYGLASQAYSNQVHFFDCDRDGDLDALLLNHNPKSLPILDEKGNKELLLQDDPFIGTRLLKQINGVFKDETQASGINGSTLSYGLGLAISDLNNDGWPDFYICNDYSVPDYLYINNQDGTFTNTVQESMRHISLSSMGNDVADMNNDGWYDIISMDMLPEDNKRQKQLLASDSYKKYDLNVSSGFHHQFMRNMFQLNNGDGTFSEIGQLAGISNTDWSWAPLLADFNNDGLKDIYITNGYNKDFTDMDFLNYMNDYVKKKGRLSRENVMEIVSHLPSASVVNYMYSGIDGYTFSNVTNSWGVEHPAKSNGVSYADLDNDGDLDLIVNNINQAAFIYQNESSEKQDNHYLQIKLVGEGLNTLGIGTRVYIFTNEGQQSLELYNSRGYLSAISPIMHFGLGPINTIDSLIVKWQSGKSQKLTNIEANQLIFLSEKDALESIEKKSTKEPLFKEIMPPVNYSNPIRKLRDFNRQPLLISELSSSGPCIVKGDINSDGLEDIFIGGSTGQIAGIYIQKRDNKFVKMKTDFFKEDILSEDTDAIIFDANNDGHVDIYVTSGGYHHFLPQDPLLQDRLYINNGNGSFIKSNGLPEMLVSTGCVVVNDVNDDGFQDLFIGGKTIPGNSPEFPKSFLLINDGAGNFTNKIDELAPQLSHLGMVTDAIWIDINKDKVKDLVVVGEWMPISVFILEGGKLVNKTNEYFDVEYKGWWNTINAGDFNNDGLPDFIVGNAGTNTQFKVSKDAPADIYFKDFDNSGSIDPFFCFYMKGISYPYITRDELIQQMPIMGSRFRTYESYSDAVISDILSQNDIEGANHLSVNNLETTLFLSTSEMLYKTSPLPIQSQFAPVYTINILDFNKDGNQDLLLCGNNSGFKLRLGSIDANYGTLLQGDGLGGFKYLEQGISGFKIIGDVRSSIQINDIIFFGVNQGQLKAYLIY